MEAELISLCQKVLNSIAQQDWDAYTELCDPSLSAFEPEGRGHLIEGMPFHEFYFGLEASTLAKQSTISSPKVRIMGNVAVVSYVRLVQALQGDGSVQTFAFEETRVWEKQGSAWKHVHFHRSVPG